MITVWPDKDDRTRFHYEFTAVQGRLIKKLLEQLTVKDLVAMGFADKEIETFSIIYQGF